VSLLAVLQGTLERLSAGRPILSSAQLPQGATASRLLQAAVGPEMRASKKATAPMGEKWICRSCLCLPKDACGAILLLSS
jgi:hypothetical protein